MSTNLPNDAHIIRYISYTRLRFDENQCPVGVIGEAFRRKPEEDGLSVTWIEAFSENGDHQRWAAVSAMRATIKVGTKSAFAWAVTGIVRDICIQRNSKIRIIHAPEDGNPGHTEIRQIPRDDDVLLDMLASEAFIDWAMNADIP